MATRTSQTIVRFSNAFLLPGFDRPQPAGDYRVAHDEESIEGASWIAWRHVGSFIHLPSLNTRGRIHQMVPINAAELDTALEKDREQSWPLQTLYNGTFARLVMTPQRISIQWGRLSGSNEALDTNLNPEASIASPARFPREKTRRNIVSGTTPKVMNGYRLRRHWNRRVKAPLSSRERSATAKAGPEGPRLVRRIADCS
jgi:hypothetical protein